MLKKKISNKLIAINSQVLLILMFQNLTCKTKNYNLSKQYRLQNFKWLFKINFDWVKKKKNNKFWLSEKEKYCELNGLYNI